MTEFYVRDETNSHEALATRILETAKTAAPLIEEVTGLPLPTVCFRLMSPDAWVSTTTHSAYVELHNAEQSGDPDRIEAARAFHTRLRRRMSAFWVLWRGQTLSYQEANGAYTARYLTVPKALQRMGLLRAPLGLERHVIHECVHQAQIAASCGKVVPPSGDAARDPRELACGHADWVANQIAHELWGGREPTGQLLRPGLRYRTAALLFHVQQVAVDRVAARHAGKPFVRPPRPVHRVVPDHSATTHFVGATVARVGVTAWNDRMWHDENAVPTPAELRNPSAWVDRMAL